MKSDLLSKGLKIRRRVMGKPYVDRVFASGDALTQDVQRLLTEVGYGAVWARPGLSLQTRSLLTIAVLAALNHPEELRGHLKGAINLGIPDQEIVEALIHLLPYAGAPAMQSGLRIARAVFAERDIGPNGKKD
jgi:4-carboxymuconolactone decarboxylase